MIWFLWYPMISRDVKDVKEKYSKLLILNDTSSYK